jgi:hypothetical protein
MVQIAFAFTAEEAKSDCNFRWMTGIGPANQRARTSKRPLILTASKDKPVLISALAGWTVVRLTDIHLTAPILERLLKFIRGPCAVAGPGTPQSTP